MPEDKVIDIGTHEMVSAGVANLTPWHCPRDYPEEEIARMLQTKILELKNPRGAIFNFHCPPVNSGPRHLS